MDTGRAVVDDEEMTAHKPYPSYRKTDLPWLGQIPAHWDAKRAKWLFSDSIDKNHSDETLLSVTQGQGVVARADAEMRVWNPGDDISGYKLVVPNEFVISLRSFEGGIEISYVRGIVSPAYVVLHPHRPQCNDYFRHLFKSRDFISNLNVSTSGIRQGKNITYWDFRELPLPIPPVEEQQAIAAYLDRQTAKIDALIAKKQRLLELLAEQRAALISQAVTKGLNPNVKMKDSGETWLGQVPSHWEVKRLKYLSAVNPSRSETNHLPEDTEVTFLPMELVGNGMIKTERIKKIADVKQGFTYMIDGDIIVAKITPSFENGKGAIADGLTSGIGFGTTELHVIRPTKKLITKFLYYLTVSYIFRNIGAGMMEGTAGQKRVPDDFITNFKTPVPPIEEQEKIVAYLEQQINHLDSLVVKAETVIERLREYRAALISSVVTGKVQVKDE